MIKIPTFTNQINFNSFFQSDQHFWCLSPSDSLKYEFERRFLVIYNYTIKIKKLKLGENFLQYSDNKYIDITNIHLQYIHHTQIEQPGFKLSRMNETLEIYGDIEEWIEYLKCYAVQFYFQQRFNILRRIERGTLQNWHSVKCKKKQIELSAIILEKNTSLNKYVLINNINMMRKLKLNLLPKMRELYESRDQIFIVFDNIEGTYIDDLKLDKQLTEQDISTIMRILFTILEYLHLHNITLGHKAIVENLYLHDPKDWSSIYILDVFDLLSPYENDNEFYQKVREDVQNFGNIMKYLLDFNVEGARLYNYELIEWSKLAFDFYQKINDPSNLYSSYDALHHPFVHHGSNYFFNTQQNSRRLFHQSSIGLKQLETSTEQNSFQSTSQSPLKKSRTMNRKSQIYSNPVSISRKNQQEDNSSQGSIDILTILEKYQQVKTCDLIIEPNQNMSEKRKSSKESYLINKISIPRAESSQKFSNKSLHNTQASDNKFIIRNTQTIKSFSRKQTLKLKRIKKNSAEL